jgi:hypothetical protein
MWLRIGTSEHGNEPLGSIYNGDFLDRLGEYWLLKEESAL